jgi:hypothetical protein
MLLPLCTQLLPFFCKTILSASRSKRSLWMRRISRHPAQVPGLITTRTPRTPMDRACARGQRIYLYQAEWPVRCVNQPLLLHLYMKTQVFPKSLHKSTPGIPHHPKKRTLPWCRGWLGLVIGSLGERVRWLICRGCRMGGRGCIIGRGCWVGVGGTSKYM